MNTIFFRLKKIISIIILFLTFITTSKSQSVDFNSPLDPPLLKKVGAYNAGVIPYSNYSRDLDKFREVNFSSFRVDLSMGKGSSFNANEPVTGTYNNPTYNFKSLDDLAKKMNSKNVLAVYSWCYIPSPFQSGGNFRNLNTSLTNWQTAWQNMHMQFSKHYKDVGIKIGQHEIMNEPDLGTLVSNPDWAFLNKDQYNSDVFKDMYKYAATGIKQGDPDAMVGGYAAACGECSGYFIDWIAQNNLPLDFYTYHNYGDGSSYPNELNAVRSYLNKYASLKTCDTYITEFSWTGDGSNTDLHHYTGAYLTLNRIKDIIARTDINFVHWAQFMETGGSDQLGTIQSNGQRLAVFNALKIFGDMPIDRKTITLNNTSLSGLASSDNHKAAVVIWNTSATAQTISLPLNNLPFSNGTLNVYRIDATHASVGDGAIENLVAAGTVTNVNSGYVWAGSIPAYGVVYITINYGTSRDFHSEDNLNILAKDIRIWHYWGDGIAANLPQRSIKNNYAEFDRKTWTAYIGEGNYTASYSITAVEAEQLPAIIHAIFTTSGTFTSTDKNSLLGLRIDFRTNGTYTKSVLFHGGIYNSSRDAEMPWGTKQQATQVVQVSLPDFKITLADYAPTGWDGRATITFMQQNTGANTRAKITLKNAVLEDIISPLQINQSDFSIYPNPVESSYLYADLSNLKNNTNYSVTITDIQGRKIFEKNNIYPNLLAIPVAGILQSGMYFMTVKGTNYNTSKKFIVK